MLTKEQIVAADDLPHVDVDVPEWGGTVRVGMMTATARNAYELELYEIIDSGEDKGRVRLNLKDLKTRLVAYTLIDENAKPMFSRAELDVLGAKSFAAIDRLYSAAQKLNKIGDAELEGDIKNSDATPSGGSSSELPASSEV